MNAWYCVPSAEGVGSHTAWSAAGFKVLMMGPVEGIRVDAFLGVENKDYKGHPWGIYTCFKHAFDTLNADICIIGSDDVFPAADRETYLSHYLHRFPEYDGILEPSGGKSEGESNLVISGFVGKEFFKNYNSGRGIYDLSYHHFYADQELAIVSSNIGKLFKDASIKFDHRHWTKTGASRPAYMSKWKALAPEDCNNFNKRSALGFSMVKWGK